MDDFQPQVFGDYYLLERIASGGMAEIFRATSFGASGFERELVVKRVLRRFTDDPEFLSMLVNEAKLTATLHHGNIAQVFELGLVDGVYFITMEYVEGVALKQLVRSLAKTRTRLGVPEAAYLTIQLCEALHYAHEKTDPMGRPLGIVHCDVSPDNALVTYDGVLKLIDFGIARAQASFSNYREGMVMGKLNYVAPEQATGRPPDRRADLFSAGIVLYELLTGEHPFGRKGDVDTLARIARFENGEVQPPEEHRPDIPPALSRFVMKALSHDREDRYPTARAFADDLLSILPPSSPALARAELLRRLQALYAPRIAARRKIRGRNDELVRELQRRSVLDQAPAGAAPSADPARIEVHARLSRRLAAGAAALGLAAGLGLGLLFAPASPPVLFVTSDPPGAEVRLEKVARGVTPLALEIEPGRAYLLEVEREGYHPHHETFTPDARRVIAIDAALTALLVPLEIESEPPGAQVEVDGRPQGVTPVKLDLPLGSTPQVRIRYGGRVEERSVELDGKDGQRLRFRFDNTKGGARHRRN